MMHAQLDFRTANGAQHPDTDALNGSPFTCLLIDNLRANQDVFGDCIIITVMLPNDGSEGILLLAPAPKGKPSPITELPVTLDMFMTDPLPEVFKKQVNDLFLKYVAAQKNGSRPH